MSIACGNETKAEQANKVQANNEVRANNEAKPNKLIRIFDFIEIRGQCQRAVYWGVKRGIPRCGRRYKEERTVMKRGLLTNLFQTPLFPLSMTSKKGRGSKKTKFQFPKGLPIKQGVETHIIGSNGTSSQIKYLSPRRDKEAHSEQHTQLSSQNDTLPSLLDYASQLSHGSEMATAPDVISETSMPSTDLPPQSNSESMPSADPPPQSCSGKNSVNNTIVSILSVYCDRDILNSYIFQKPHIKTFGFIQDWAQIMLDEMLLHETDAHLGKPCYQCKSPSALYRCHDCCSGPLLCKSCTIEVHRCLPLHRIQFWNGSYFERQSLKDLGYIFYLGHHGKRCPNQITNTKLSTLTVVDTTGVYPMDVMYCKCRTEASVFGDEHAVQLWRVGLWPATYSRPQTVFSCHALNLFEALTLQAKTSAYDFMGTLRRLTNNAFPKDVKVRTIFAAFP